MKHNWERHRDSETIRRPCQRWRVCTHCHSEQQHTSNQEWGRVKGYSWWPLVGRCKPTIKVSGKFGTHSSAIFLVRTVEKDGLDEPPSEGDRVCVRSPGVGGDSRVEEWTEVLVDQVKTLGRTQLFCFSMC